MKSIGINEDMHRRIKKISEKTGIMIYRLVLQAIEYLEEKYEMNEGE